MSSTLKGIVSVVISAIFFFPWIWLRILKFYLHINVSTYPVFIVGTIAAIIAIILGIKARNEGSRILGTVGVTLGIISVVLNLLNFASVTLSHF